MLAFTINKIPRGHVDIVLIKNNDLYISSASLKKFNINKSNKSKINYYDQDYYRLDKEQFKYSIQQVTSTIEITVPPEQFIKTVIEPNHIWHQIKEPGSGAYINYDLLYKYTKEPSVKKLDGLLNTTAFHKQNILTSDFKISLDKKSNNNKLTRLETKFIRDFPDKLVTLTIGDSRSIADLWGNPILLGGIQLATNFELQPGFVYYPLPDITGVATIPSAIDLYINDTNRQRKNLQEGPFEILDIPIINGSGQIEVIEKDILGREKTYSIPYYLSSYSLKSGIKQYSITTGALRNNFAKENDGYKHFAAIGNYRQGINNNFTYALRGELKEKQSTFGIRTTFSKEKIGELNLVASASFQNQTKSGAGGLFKAVYINQFANKLNFNITADAITTKYISLGDDPDKQPYRASLQTFVGIPFGYSNSLTLNYITRDNRNKPSQSIISANYYHNIKNIVNIGLSSQYDFNNSKRKLLFLNIVRSFPKHNITSSIASNIETDQKPRYIFDINKGISDYNGYGYHLRASRKQNIDILADIKYNSEYNSLQAEYNHLNHENNYRFSARGGIAYFDKEIFITRTIADSFAVVDTDKINNIHIYHNNRLITKSKSNGRAIIPQLNSYNLNKIALDPSELPLNAQFDKTNIEFTPYRYSGSKLKFDIQQHNAVIMRLIDNNNKPILTGTHIANTKEKLLTIVGFDGQVYLNIANSSPDQIFEAHWLDGQCKFQLPNIPNKDSVTDINIGNIKCTT